MCSQLSGKVVGSGFTDVQFIGAGRFLAKRSAFGNDGYVIYDGTTGKAVSLTQFQYVKLLGNGYFSVPTSSAGIEMTDIIDSSGSLAVRGAYPSNALDKNLGNCFDRSGCITGCWGTIRDRFAHSGCVAACRTTIRDRFARKAKYRLKDSGNGSDGPTTPCHSATAQGPGSTASSPGPASCSCSRAASRKEVGSSLRNSKFYGEVSTLRHERQSSTKTRPALASLTLRRARRSREDGESVDAKWDRERDTSRLCDAMSSG